MNTKRSRPRLGLLLLLALLPAACLSPSRARTDTVLIFHTNDLHSALRPDGKDGGGLARIAGAVEAARSRRLDVLYLDAGDGVTGAPVSTLFQGRPVFHVLSVAGLDAMALGNHEFDHGWRRISDYRRLAVFPLLSANVRGPGGALLADAPYVVLDADGVRVGVIGLTTDETPKLTARGLTEGVVFEPPAQALRRVLPEVRARSDIVVVLSHLGYEADRALASAVPGADLIVGGHSHTVLPEPVRVGNTLIVQAGSRGRFLGRLELLVDLRRGRILRAREKLIPVTADLPVSAAAAVAVRDWEDRVRARVDVTIGRAAAPRDPAALKEAVERIYREALGTDLAFQNPGGIRAELGAGPITIRAIWKVLPFDNTLVTLRVRGADLPDELRARVRDLDPARVYTVATNSYVAAHLEEYFPAGVEGSKETGLPMRDVVIEAVRRRGDLP